MTQQQINSSIDLQTGTWQHQNFNKAQEKSCRTFLRLAERRLHLLQPANLGDDGAGVPDALVDAMSLEEGVIHSRGAGDSEVGALLEVLAVGLRRRRQGQPEMLSYREEIPINKKRPAIGYLL